MNTDPVAVSLKAFDDTESPLSTMRLDLFAIVYATALVTCGPWLRELAYAIDIDVEGVQPTGRPASRAPPALTVTAPDSAPLSTRTSPETPVKVTGAGAPRIDPSALSMRNRHPDGLVNVKVPRKVNCSSTTDMSAD